MTMIKNAIVLKALLPEVALLREQLSAAEWGPIADTDFFRAASVPALRREDDSQRHYR